MLPRETHTQVHRMILRISRVRSAYFAMVSEQMIDEIKYEAVMIPNHNSKCLGRIESLRYEYSVGTIKPYSVPITADTKQYNIKFRWFCFLYGL